jgi:polyisoprenoid-binding protein YceI
MHGHGTPRPYKGIITNNFNMRANAVRPYKFLKLMKKFLLTASLLSLLSASVFAAEEAVSDNKYTIESNHAFVSWKADHLGFSHQTGKFSALEGTITFDEKNPQKSAVDATIKLSSLATGLDGFNDHLKSDDFFSVKKFPVAKFVSTKVVVTGKNKAKVTGDLTIRDVTKPVTLDVVFNKSGANPFSQKPTIGFSAKTTIKRSDFGINYALPAVADNVEISIEVEANR